MLSDTKSRGEDRRSHSLVRRVVWSLCASAVIPGAMETYGARVPRVEIHTVNNIVSTHRRRTGLILHGVANHITARARRSACVRIGQGSAGPRPLATDFVDETGFSVRLA